MKLRSQHTFHIFVTQVSNTPSNASVDRRKVSSVKVTASKSDTSKIEKKILTKSPAVKDGLPTRPAFPNKKTISDAPRQAIGRFRIICKV